MKKRRLWKLLRSRRQITVSGGFVSFYNSHMSPKVECDLFVERYPSNPLPYRHLVSQARLPLRRRVPSDFSTAYSALSRAPNEVGVNINWDAFCKVRSSTITQETPLSKQHTKKGNRAPHASLTQLIINMPRNSWRARNEMMGIWPDPLPVA